MSKQDLKLIIGLMATDLREWEAACRDNWKKVNDLRAEVSRLNRRIKELEDMQAEAEA